MKGNFKVNVAVVLLTYMEAENIETLIPAIKGVVSRVTENFDVIVVDDDSPDGTARAAEALGSHVLIRRNERGLGSAIRAGIREALSRGADVIITMDADWQHNPQHIPRLINACLEGADIALGSRRIPGGQLEMGLFRGLISLGAKKLSNIALRSGVKDPTSGFRAYNRRAAEEVLALRTNGYVFQVDSLRLARKRGLRIVEAPISFNSRKHGVSKLGLSEVMEYSGLLFTLLTRRLRTAVDSSGG